MKKLVFVILLLFVAYSVNAQGYISMNQDQLNLALEKAQRNIRTGTALTIIGSIAVVGGITMYISGLSNMLDVNSTTNEVDKNLDKSLIGIFITAGGVGFLGAGIPILIIGKNKKDKIEIALLRFKSTGFLYERNSAPIYGVGFKITF